MYGRETPTRLGVNAMRRPGKPWTLPRGGRERAQQLDFLEQCQRGAGESPLSKLALNSTVYLRIPGPNEATVGRHVG
ncbi:hypothetical protein chiPu_0023780 [Chiloscyllium punctatum]|uniref:Uncharacterized protein n=1 Tax=Chiloscyllium punctatum TaxID=137246 RepID=A0A401TAL3_CHIPU|nr:hypothetical protein [Chiloscyllium punctatum]